MTGIMTMKKYANLVAFIDESNAEHGRFEVKFIENYSSTSEAYYLWAFLLSEYDHVYASLKASRIDLGLEPSFALQYDVYSRYRLNGDSIGAISLGYVQSQTRLAKVTYEFLRQFRLTPNWFDSVRLLILAHILILPPENKAATASALSKTKVTIHINESISKSQLLQQIKSLNKDIAALPKPPSSNVRLKTLQWGRAVQLLGGATRSLTNDSWIVDIHEELESLITEEVVPSSDELRKYYERYLSYLSKQFQPSVLT